MIRGWVGLTVGHVSQFISARRTLHLPLKLGCGTALRCKGAVVGLPGQLWENPHIHWFIITIFSRVIPYDKICRLGVESRMFRHSHVGATFPRHALNHCGCILQSSCLWWSSMLSFVVKVHWWGCPRNTRVTCSAFLVSVIIASLPVHHTLTLTYNVNVLWYCGISADSLYLSVHV